MAGDWMKIELELPDKPEVHSLAAMLNLDSDAVVGKLIRVWQWFDKHTVDGNAFGVTFSLPDRISGVSGFGEAMQFVGWLEQQDKYLVMPKFDRHTSKSAKTRALTAKRVSDHKNKSNAEGNASSVSVALPREEKRRDKNKGSRLPDDWVIPDDWFDEAKAINPSLVDSQIKYIADGFKDHWISATGATAVKGNWLATWRNWIRRQNGLPKSAPSRPSKVAL